MTTVNTKQAHYNEYYQCQTNALQWLANTKTKKKKQTNMPTKVKYHVINRNKQQ